MPIAPSVVTALSSIVGDESVLVQAEDLIPYSFDGTAALKQRPEAVVFPRNAEQVASCVKLAGAERIPVVTRGSGTGLSGGSIPSPGSLVLCVARMNAILDVDPRNLTLRAQPGAVTQRIDEAAGRHGLFYPPDPGSMRISTIGGNVAENSGGLRGLKYGVTRDYVMGLEVVLPDGRIARFGNQCVKDVAGYSLKDLFIGSEGTLGVITEAWMRLQDRPRLRASCSVPFDDFLAATRAVRAISQAGLFPSNCRLLDAGEAETAGAGDGTDSVLILGFESADHSLDPWIARALECAADHGGRVPSEPVRTRTDDAAAREGAAGAWRNAFLTAPYLRDALVGMGFLTETFETAIPWNRFERFHREVMAATEDAVRRVCGGGRVTCRFTHVYPDGPAPYYTILAPSRHDAQIEQWAEIKAAASETLIREGGTITHHHAVGRDHRPWYDQQRPDGFARALGGAKRALDPAGILNPGVLID